jgi:hypothetical protein
MNYKLRTENNLAFEFYFNPEAFKDWLIFRKINLPSLDDMWKEFRRVYCPTRITQYGKLGIERGLADDRTKFEKFCDIISGYFQARRDRINYQRSRVRNGFSFFDWRYGKNITNLSEIHEIEKKTGTELLSWKEIDQIRSQVKRDTENATVDKFNKQIHGILSNVQKGHSYIREMKERQAKVRKEHGLTI